MANDGDAWGPDDGDAPASWQTLSENIYLIERRSTKNGRREKKMECDCELEYDENGAPMMGCGEDCINKLLLIECNPKICACGEFCGNQRFQRREYANVSTFKAGLKGWGLRADADLPEGVFVMEYCGEVCTFDQFQDRTANYFECGRRHHYFMTLRSDEIIDATLRGNQSRFMNHSCDPNCETQKWTVNGRLRVGFFTIKPVSKGDELTFDYQFQRYGSDAQPCYCGSSNCRGVIGGKQKVEKSRPRASSTKGIVHVVMTPEPTQPSPPLEDELTLEVKQMRSSNGGLTSLDDVLALSRMMVKADGLDHRLLILDTLRATDDSTCLRKFLRLQGLSLLWSWMVDIDDTGGKKVAASILDVLFHLPIPNRNVLDDSKVLATVQKWSQLMTKGQEAKVSKNNGQSIANFPVATVGEASNAESTDAPATSPRHEAVMKNGECSPLFSSSPEAARERSECNGVLSSDSEQERSRTVDLATEQIQRQALVLLDNWSTLKEVYRIPKKAPKACQSPKKEKADSSPPSGTSRTVGDDRYRDDKRFFKRDRESLSWRRERDSPNSRFGSRNGCNNSPQMRWNDPVRRSRHSSPSREHSSRWKHRHSSSTDHGLLVMGTQVQTSSQLSSAPPPMMGALPVPGTITSPLYSHVQAPALPSSSAVMSNTSLANNLNAYPPSVLPPAIMAAAVAAGIPPPPIIRPMQPVMMAMPRPMVMQSAMHAGVDLTGQGVISGGIVLTQRHIAGTTLGEEAMVLGDSSGGEDLIGSQNAEEGSDTPEENLPPQWRSARDTAGKIYYYHVVRRVSQWERPTDEDFGETPPLPPEDPPEEEEPREPDTTPPADVIIAHSPLAVLQASSLLKKERIRNGEVNDLHSHMHSLTSSLNGKEPRHRHASSSKERGKSGIPPLQPLDMRRKRDDFRGKLSAFVVTLLNPYRKADCKCGRITSTDDFKYLARKLTHGIVDKELQRKSEIELEMTDSVRFKTQEFVRNYMKKFGKEYART